MNFSNNSLYYLGYYQLTHFIYDLSRDTVLDSLNFLIVSLV